jgi:hypothetical protein
MKRIYVVSLSILLALIVVAPLTTSADDIYIPLIIGGSNTEEASFDQASDDLVAPPPTPDLPRLIEKQRLAPGPTLTPTPSALQTPVPDMLSPDYIEQIADKVADWESIVDLAPDVPETDKLMLLWKTKAGETVGYLIKNTELQTRVAKLLEDMGADTPWLAVRPHEWQYYSTYPGATSTP